MKLAFCLFRYFPYGGLQRDFLRIASECLSRGHSVHVFAGQWEGQALAGAELTLIRPRGLSNHVRCRNFSDDLQPLLTKGKFDAVVGFNKMEGLDLYYAADSCFMARHAKRGLLCRIGSRYRTLCALERQVFAPDKETSILMISPHEQSLYQACYGTHDKNFHLLPPGVAYDRVAPPDSADIRAAMRRQLGLGDEDLLLLMIGSSFRTKGVDRAVRALAALPGEIVRRVSLLVVGQGASAPFRRLALRFGVAGRVRFLGARDDVPRFLLAADLLIHPARTENTGTVLLEALASRLPVLASAACGYAGHVEAANAGRIIPEPFDQVKFNELLNEVLMLGNLEEWRHNAADYVARTDIFSLVASAADLIEQFGARRAHD